MAGDGWPLPWPFPWSLPTPAASSSRSENLALSDGEARFAGAAPGLVESVMAEAAQLRARFGAVLPPVKSVELYLIEGLSEVTSSTGAKTLAVIFPPEFLVVLDVGLDCLVGGSVSWIAVGYGDPLFPEKRPIDLRSVTGRTQANIIFPKVAGSLIIGLREGAPQGEVKAGLAGQGLQDVTIYDFFATASCRPFEEPTICRKLEASLPFVKYAEPNGVQRLIDFSPGWAAKRLN